MTNNGKLTVPSALKHLMPQKHLAGGITSGFARIGIKGKVFTLYHQKQAYRFIREDDNTVLPYIDAVILDANPNKSKLYYPGTYNEDTTTGPTCAAINGDVPDPGVPVPQSKTCGTCRHNEWITLPNGGRGKECQDHKRVAILLLPYMKTLPAMPAPLQEPVYFKVTPASLGAWKSYTDWLQHQGLNSAQVITRISFDPIKNWLMKFEAKQPLTNDDAPAVVEALESPLIRAIIGTTTEIVEDSEPAHLPLPNDDDQLQAIKPKAKRIAAAEPEDEVLEGEVVPPPKERKKREAVPPPQDDAQTAFPWEESAGEMDKDLANLLSQKTGDMLK